MNGSDIRMPDNGRDNRRTTATAALAGLPALARRA